MSSLSHHAAACGVAYGCFDDTHMQGNRLQTYYQHFRHDCEELMEKSLRANIEATSTTPDINAQSRYSFTAQFIMGSAIFADRSHAIEGIDASTIDEKMRAEHLSYVVSAVVQCAAALESEISEITLHGPGHHLGSNRLDVVARDFLEPLMDVIDDQSTLQRYELVLHLLKKPAIAKGGQIHENADLLIKLRNELIHYKSKWGPEMDRQKFFSRLQRLGLEKPPFILPNANFFPHRCMSASLASWSVMAAVAYINDFYKNLGIKSPLQPYADRLIVPSVKIASTA